MHLSIKFDQKYSKSKIEFFNVSVDKGGQLRLQTTLFRKNTDRQSYLPAKFDYPVSLKKVYCTVKYCVSKESVQQTAYLSTIVNIATAIYKKRLSLIFD